MKLQVSRAPHGRAGARAAGNATPKPRNTLKSPTPVGQDKCVLAREGGRGQPAYARPGTRPLVACLQDMVACLQTLVACLQSMGMVSCVKQFVYAVVGIIMYCMIAAMVVLSPACQCTGAGCA